MSDCHEFIVECIPSDNGMWWPSPAYVDPSRPNTTEIVHCRDCERMSNNGYGCTLFGRREYVGSYRWEDVPAEVEPDGFCAWGERAGGAL